MKKNGEYVGVDEKFIPENEKYVDESLLGNKEESKKTIKKVAKGIGIGYLVYIGFILAFVIGMMIFVFTMFNNTRKTQVEMMDSFQQKQDEMMNSVQQQQNIDGITSSFQQNKDEMINSVQQQQNEFEKTSFNSNFELYSGTKTKLLVTTILDKVVTNNKTNSDKIIRVIYNTTNTIEPNEIVELKKSFKQGKEYEVMLDYDTNGFVNKVTIMDIE